MLDNSPSRYTRNFVLVLYVCWMASVENLKIVSVPLNNPHNNVDPILHQFANLTHQYQNKACTPTEYGFSYSRKAMAHDACDVNFVVSSITIVGSFCKIGTF